MTRMQPEILILLGAFWPGHESTGPNLTLKAMCEALGDQFRFSLIARDRPFGGNAAIVESGRWHDLGFARAQYLPVGRGGARGLARLIRETPHDLLLLNGFFDREFTIPALAARRLGRFPRKPAMLSPRGEFSGGALGLKGGRKALYRRIVALTGLLDDVVLHATSDAEDADLKRAFPGRAIRKVANFRPLFDRPAHKPRAPGTPLRVAFVGRISPVKGLDIALTALARVDAQVVFDIFGPVSDAAYWARCQALIAALPPHVTATHRGEIANRDVACELAGRDLMLMPSLSENFGHAIFESLAAGTPVAIGDQTPWRGLEAVRAGFDLPLGDPALFANAVDRIACFGPEENLAWRLGARQVAENYVAGSVARDQMARLLTDCVTGNG